jgi:hypothetical protein
MAQDDEPRAVPEVAVRGALAALYREASRGDG